VGPAPHPGVYTLWTAGSKNQNRKLKLKLAVYRSVTASVGSLSSVALVFRYRNTRAYSDFFNIPIF